MLSKLDQIPFTEVFLTETQLETQTQLYNYTTSSKYFFILLQSNNGDGHDDNLKLMDDCS